MSPLDPQIPPPGEEIHLPGPSMLPFLLTLALTAAIVGLTLGPVFWIPGVILAVVFIWRWIRETREEIEHLPLEHRH